MKTTKQTLLAVCLLTAMFAEALPPSAAQGQNQRLRRLQQLRSAAASPQSAQNSRAEAASTNSDLDFSDNKKVKEKQEEQKTEKKNKAKESASKQESKCKNKVRGDAPCVSWVKFGVPVRALVLCIHGLGLNSSSFESLGQDLSARGIAVYAIDVRGFGSWMEAKGHSKVNFKDCIEDVRKAVDWITKSEPGKPIFLLGESMGGAIALQSAAEFPELLSGVISACAAAERFDQKKTDLSVFLQALTGPLKEVDLKESVLEKAAGDNVELKSQWEGDPLARLKLSPLELLQFQRFMNDNHDAARDIKSLPVLMVQGVNDKLVKPEGTQELFEELKTKDKEILWVENGEHLIFENKQYSMQTLEQVSSWILAHCPSPAESLAELLEKARVAIEGGKAAEAVPFLTEAQSLAPKNPQLHLLFGKSLMQTEHFAQARQHLVQTIRMAKGSPLAAEANRLLMQLPQKVLSAQAQGKSPLRRQPGAKPRVIVFNAAWCKPCQDMNEIVEKARAKVGDKVEFSLLDVDDPQNEELLDQYSIGPVPTTVFITADGRLAGSEVGFSGVDGLLRGMQDILKASPKGARRPPPGQAARLKGRLPVRPDMAPSR